MIFKSYPFKRPPHGRIDEVIYYFGVPLMAFDMVVLGVDLSDSNLKYWDGSAWVTVPLLQLVGGHYPPGIGDLITGLLPENVVAGVFPIGMLFSLPLVDDAAAVVQITADGDLSKPLVIQLTYAQTANGIEVQKEDGTPLFWIDSVGTVRSTSGVTVDGSITSTSAGLFGTTVNGDGSPLTNLTAANLSGPLPGSAPDGTYSPVNSITLVNGVITAIS